LTKRVIYTDGTTRSKDGRSDKAIPKYSKEIANDLKYYNNLYDRLAQQERNKLYVQKIRSSKIDNGVLIFTDRAKKEKQLRLSRALKEFSTPQIIHRKMTWNLGGGMNPFLAYYIDDHKYEIKKPTWRVRKCLN